MERLYAIVKDQQTAAAESEQRMIRLEGMMEKLLQNQAASTHNVAQSGDGAISTGGGSTVNQINTSVRNEVTVNVFGKENLGHITQAQVYHLLTKPDPTHPLPDAAAQAVLEAAILAYSDPEHPENITCYIPNKKTTDALVHEQHGWCVQPVGLVLSPMLKSSVDLLFDKQPFGEEEGLPERPDLTACGRVLKALMEFEKDPQSMKKMTGPNGQLRAVLIRNKDLLTRVLKELPVAGQS